MNERYQHSVNRERIEWMKRLNYVFTFTYDDKKYTERNFYRGLRSTLAQIGWEYIGVWRRGGKGKRLYFYAAIRVNGGGMYEMNSFLKEYKRAAGRRKRVLKNIYFSERFGSTVVSPLRRSNRRLWQNVLAALNEKRAKLDAQGIDKKTFVGDYEGWMRKKKQRRKT